MTLRILSVQNIYTNRFDVPKVSFKSNRGDTYGKERINRKEFYEDNYNDAFNKEYQPVKYDKITMVHGKPAVLPSERMLRQNKSSFRENELFYDDVDSIDFVPTKYDTDDVPLDRHLWMGPSKGICSEYAPDTLIPPDSFYNCYDAVRTPWLDDITIKDNRELEHYQNLVYSTLKEDNNISYKEMKDIFKSSSLIKNGKEQIDVGLSNLAVKIYRNSKIWDETEKSIMDEIRIPIYKKVYGGYSVKKYIYVDKCLRAGYSNEEILDFLQDFYPGYVIDLSSIMTDKEVNEYNKSLSNN